MWGKTAENYSRENPRSQVGTENLIYISASVGIRTGVLEVESEARHTNLELAYFDIKIPMEDQKQELLPLNEIKLQDNEKKTFEEVLCLFMIEKNLILLFHINQYGHKKQFNYS